MQVHILKSKIHKARLTFCDLKYEGSLAIDEDLMDRVGIVAGERLLVVNASNGERLETYAIPEERGGRCFGLNGAAARKGEVGDEITVMVFGIAEQDEARDLKPRVIVLDHENAVVSEK
ncbi:MAG: aspartate 1-decarboxylase [Verrucomicrobiota bacterium]